jgi:hypothetical protein
MLDRGTSNRRFACGRDASRWMLSLLAALAVLTTGTRGAAAQGLEEYDYANLGFRAIGVDVLYADASQGEGAVGIGARIDLGFLGPYIRVVPRFAFWNADVDENAVDELERQIETVSGLAEGSVNLGSIERDYWVLATDLQWTLPDSYIRPYIGLGVDVYILDDSGTATQGTFLDDAVITAGLSGVAGLEIDFSSVWRVYGDVRGALVTDASNLAFSLGVAYRLGGRL